jgi:UPF0042 nucleotide-binding protein
MRLVVVSGLSGSGKSVTLNTLEDAGFYCIDNLPVGLLPILARELMKSSPDLRENTAIGVDARNLAVDLRRFPEILMQLRDMGIDCEVLFLEADNETLLKRFSETRRRHPLTSDTVPLKEAIQNERVLLETISEHADLNIDTTQTNIYQLRDLVSDRLKRPSKSLSVLFQSFGFKHGVPADADFVFDVRCLPNPNWEPALRSLTGLDQEVGNYMEQQPGTREMFKSVSSFLETWIPKFEAENRNYLTVAVGCTGGQHRSVYLVKLLAAHFLRLIGNVQVRHRELQ